jgi:hypothetical protein
MRTSKYDPLREWLTRAPHPAEVSFGLLSQLVGGLPPSAYRRREWWANNMNGHVQARAWLEAGRRVSSVDLPNEKVVFA